MNQVNTGDDILSETTVGQADNENLKLVPVAESIRYRKRAQSAEKKIEALAEQLADARSEATQMAEQLRDMQIEQKLVRKLAAAGAVDLEASVLIAKTRIAGDTEANLDECVEGLKQEKRYLFSDNVRSTAAAQRTSGVKDRVQSSRSILDRSAKKAATTGNRTDLQEYLRLRRNFL